MSIQPTVSDPTKPTPGPDTTESKPGPTTPTQDGADDDATALPPSTYDPSAANVDDVLAHLDDLDDEDDVLAVLRAEQAGKARASILKPYASLLEPDDAPAGDDPVGETVTPGSGLDAGDDDRPVWNVETHGKPSASQRARYRVVGE